jgi:hypothetical protein
MTIVRDGKRIRTEKDRINDKKYNERKITFGIGYSTVEDIKEGNRLKKYLLDNNLSANSYIKSLIKSDLDRKQVPYE